MFTPTQYTLEAGSFTVISGILRFAHPTVRIPLVQNVNIGRIENNDEEAYCNGLYLPEATHDFGKNIYNPLIGLVSRPSYDGKKLIFPPEGQLRPMSRNQGDIIFNPPTNISYLHRTENSQTALWTPQKGIVEIANKPGDVLEKIIEDEGAYPSETYLLFGGLPNESKVDRMFQGSAYYARIELSKVQPVYENTMKAFRID